MPDASGKGEEAAASQGGATNGAQGEAPRAVTGQGRVANGPRVANHRLLSRGGEPIFRPAVRAERTRPPVRAATNGA